MRVSVSPCSSTHHIFSGEILSSGRDLGLGVSGFRSTHPWLHTLLQLHQTFCRMWVNLHTHVSPESRAFFITVTVMAAYQQKQRDCFGVCLCVSVEKISHEPADGFE